MALLAWSKKYSVGVKKLDDQHEAFMGSLNDLHSAMMMGKGQEIGGPLLDKLVKHARDHFAAEESLMESSRYPGLAGHRALHQDLTRKVDEFMARYKSGDKAMYLQLLHFMRTWLDKHLLEEDSKYVPWLKEHGVS